MAAVRPAENHGKNATGLGARQRATVRSGNAGPPDGVFDTEGPEADALNSWLNAVNLARDGGNQMMWSCR